MSDVLTGKELCAVGIEDCAIDTVALAFKDVRRSNGNCPQKNRLKFTFYANLKTAGVSLG